MAELLASQPLDSLDPGTGLPHPEGFDPSNPAATEAMTNRLDAAVDAVAAAKQALEGGVGRGIDGRSEALRAGLQELGQSVEDAHPNASQFDKIQNHIAALRVADGRQSAEHGETPGAVSRVLTRVGGLRVMQSIARHARVYKAVGVGLALAGAAATVATGGVAGLAAVGANYAVRATRGAVVGAAVGVAGERAARQQRNTSEAIGARNTEQEHALNDFMLRNIKAIAGRGEDEAMSSDELAAHVNKMAGGQYDDLRARLINHIVETSRGLGEENTQNRRSAMWRGARSGAVGGVAAGGISHIIPGVESLVHHAGAAHAGEAASSGSTAPTPEQIQSALHTAQEHGSAMMNNAHTNYPDQGTLWATLQDHGTAVHGHTEQLSNAVTEKEILGGYSAMHTHGFDVQAHGLTLDPNTHAYTPDGNTWWADVKAPHGGAWVVEGHTNSYIPGGEHLSNSQMAAVIDAQHNGAHFETPDQFKHNLVSELTKQNAAHNTAGATSGNAAANIHMPDAGQAAESAALGSVESPWPWVEDIAAGAAVALPESAVSADQARLETEQRVQDNEAAYDAARAAALVVANNIGAAGAPGPERLNAFAEALFAADSQVARFLVDARARGAAEEDTAEQALLAAMGFGPAATPDLLRQDIGERFRYRRGLQELAIHMAGNAAGAELTAVDMAADPANAGARLNEFINRLQDPGRYPDFPGLAGVGGEVTNALNANNAINQRLLLAALRIDNFDVAGLRQAVAARDIDELATAFNRRRGGRPGDPADSREAATRVTDFYDNEYSTAARALMIAEVSARNAAVMDRAVDALNVSALTDAAGLREQLADCSALRVLGAELATAEGVANLANVDAGDPDGATRIDNFMDRLQNPATPEMTEVSTRLSAALNTDNAIRQELLFAALRLNNWDIPAMRQEVATRDAAALVAQFRGGAAQPATGDQAESDARLGDLYNDFRTNPRRWMLLDVDSGTAGVLTPVVAALNINNLDDFGLHPPLISGLSAEQQLHRLLSVRDVEADLGTGSAGRPAAWAGAPLNPADADFGVSVVSRLQDMVENISAGERLGMSRWQSGQNVMDLLSIGVNLRVRAERDAFWAALAGAYGMAPGSIHGWEDALNNLPPRP